MAKRLERQTSRHHGRVGRPIGTTMAQQHLRNILAYLNPRSTGPEAFIHNKEGLYDAIGNMLKQMKFGAGWMHTLAWVQRHA
jgi:chromate reductase